MEHADTKMRERRISTWSELNEVLFEDTWDDTIRRFRSTFAYRGVAAENYALTNKLDQSNITERVLMPGLDGLCAWLRRHYKPV
jgi:hypothetical protein